MSFDYLGGMKMREAQWEDYELIDCSDGERLERWGDIILIRPDPQIIWHTGSIIKKCRSSGRSNIKS